MTVCNSTTMIKRAVVTLVCVGASTLTLSACDSNSQQLVGLVTTLSPHLCVGRHSATGKCFDGANSAAVARLHIGECVQITYSPSGNNGPAPLKDVQTIDASAHRTDCPSPP